MVLAIDAVILNIIFSLWIDVIVAVGVVATTIQASGSRFPRDLVAAILSAMSKSPAVVALGDAKMLSESSRGPSHEDPSAMIHDCLVGLLVDLDVYNSIFFKSNVLVD